MKNKDILKKILIRYDLKNQWFTDKNRINECKMNSEDKSNQPIDLKENSYSYSYLKATDTGRSMTEMLGTLAVIGVLSIGGISGYRYAMNQYRVNQITNELNLVRNELQIKMANGNEHLILGAPYDTEETIGEGHLQSNETYKFAYDCGDGAGIVSDCRDEVNFYMETMDIPPEICKPLTRLFGNLSELELMHVNNVEDGECNSDKNNILFVFGADVILDNRDLPEDYCRVEEDCDPTKPICENHECKACPGGKEWNTDNQTCEVKECEDNSKCNTSINYCKITSFSEKTGQCDRTTREYYYNLKGTCTEIKSSSNIDVPDVGKVYRSESKDMNWFSARNWCEAQGMHLLNISDNRLKCYKSGTATPFTIGEVGTTGDCCAESKNCSSDKNLVSSQMDKITEVWSGQSWTATAYFLGDSSCSAYAIDHNNKSVFKSSRNNARSALCQY